MIKILLALLGAAKFGKILTVVGTMLLSIGAYALLYGWRFAVGFVLLILVHEMGHYVAARQRGLDVGVPTFIPFVGAWIQLKDQPMNAETEAYVGFAGPLIGSIGALACYFAAREMNSHLLLALAYTGFFLNLFNLIPLSPFDGGRITAVLSPRLWLLGVPVLIAAYFYWAPSPILILMAIMAAPNVWKALTFKKRDPDNASYYSASLETKLTYGTFYVGLIVFLALMCHNLHLMLGSGP